MTQSSQGQFSQQDYTRLKAYLMESVTRAAEGHPPSGPEYRQQVIEWLNQAFARLKLNLDDRLREKAIREVLAELVGYGPIQPLLDDPENSEIMVCGPKQVYIER
ncbi:MAG: CpaF family protein, partial [Chloroflexi bacterium]|nr:CpaF family protein [Chloroflexota bacterium]